MKQAAHEERTLSWTRLLAEGRGAGLTRITIGIECIGPIGMASYFLILLIAATATLMVATYSLFRRASFARRELSEQIHDRSLGLDLRCDTLQSQIDELTRQRRRDTFRSQRDHLLTLVSSSQVAGLLSAPAAEALRRYVLELHLELPEPAADEIKA